MNNQNLFINIYNMTLLFKLFSFLFIVATVYGLYTHYSPVPYADMWNGYLDFYVRVMDGDSSIWFAQHNEHRIIFAKILFYIDLKYFDGLSIFLTLVNLLFMVLLSVLYIFIVNEFYKGNEENTVGIKNILISLLIVLSFSWIQNENIIWAFQGQFFAAYLFPLFAFYLLVKSVDRNSNIIFTMSVVFGVISAGTMINGVIALPILFLLTIVLRRGWMKILLVSLVSIVVLYFYFKGYVSPGGHTSIFDTLVNHPLEFFKYLFAYLGSVFYYLLGEENIFIAQLSGVFLLSSALFFGYLVVTNSNINKFYFVILGFLLYYGGAAFGTSGGRAFLGIEQAFSSRYMTPSLIAWSLVAIGWSYYFKNNLKVINGMIIGFILVSVLLFSYQLKVFENLEKSNFDKKVSVLALAMGVQDEVYIKKIFPFVDWVIDISKKPIERNLSIFGVAYIKDVQDLIGRKIDFLPEVSFMGSVDSYESVKEDIVYMRIYGWISDKETKSVPSSLVILNEENEVIGYVLTRQERENIFEREVYKSRFIGYIKKEKLKSKIFLVDMITMKYLEVAL